MRNKPRLATMPQGPCEKVASQEIGACSPEGVLRPLALSLTFSGDLHGNSTVCVNRTHSGLGLHALRAPSHARRLPGYGGRRQRSLH